MYPNSFALNYSLPKASKHLEGLVLNKSHGKTRRTRRLAATRAGSHSGFQLEGGRILKSVASFLVNSHAIQTLEIDNVAINLSMVQALGQSFSERQEALNLGAIYRIFLTSTFLNVFIFLRISAY